MITSNILGTTWQINTDTTYDNKNYIYQITTEFSSYRFTRFSIWGDTSTSVYKIYFADSISYDTSTKVTTCTYPYVECTLPSTFIYYTDESTSTTISNPNFKIVGGYSSDVTDAKLVTWLGLHGTCQAEQLSDLTDTKWEFKDFLLVPTSNLSYSFLVKYSFDYHIVDSEGATHDGSSDQNWLKIDYKTTSLDFGFTDSPVVKYSQNTANSGSFTKDSFGLVEGENWEILSSALERKLTIHFTGGLDVTNSNLIKFMLDNATQVETQSLSNLRYQLNDSPANISSTYVINGEAEVDDYSLDFLSLYRINSNSFALSSSSSGLLAPYFKWDDSWYYIDEESESHSVDAPVVKFINGKDIANDSLVTWLSNNATPANSLKNTSWRWVKNTYVIDTPTTDNRLYVSGNIFDVEFDYIWFSSSNNCYWPYYYKGSTQVAYISSVDRLAYLYATENHKDIRLDNPITTITGGVQADVEAYFNWFKNNAELVSINEHESLAGTRWKIASQAISLPIVAGEVNYKLTIKNSDDSKYLSNVTCNRLGIGFQKVSDGPWDTSYGSYLTFAGPEDVYTAKSLSPIYFSDNYYCTFGSNSGQYFELIFTDSAELASNKDFIYWMEHNATELVYNYSITNNLSNCSLSPVTVDLDTDYVGTITPNTGYASPEYVQVGTDYYKVASNKFKISADKITSDFSVSAYTKTMKDIKIHPIVNGAQDLTTDLYPKTKASNLIDVTATPEEIDYLSGATSNIQTQIDTKSAVSVSSSGTATDVVNYITVNGVEKRLAGGSGITYEEIV